MRFNILRMFVRSFNSSGATGDTSDIDTASLLNDTDESANSTYFDVSADYDDEDLDASWDSADATAVTLNGDSVSTDGDGAEADGNVITITAAGTYVFSGTLNDGQIIVNTEDEDIVKLVLNGADITCSDSTPIYVMNAEKPL